MPYHMTLQNPKCLLQVTIPNDNQMTIEKTAQLFLLNTRCRIQRGLCRKKSSELLYYISNFKYIALSLPPTPPTPHPDSQLPVSLLSLFNDFWGHLPKMWLVQRLNSQTDEHITQHYRLQILCSKIFKISFKIGKLLCW
jgi:hypothetical protein